MARSSLVTLLAVTILPTLSEAGGYIGVSVRAAPPNGVGILVLGVSPGDPADKAGLKIGDVIQRVDDQEMKKSDVLKKDALKLFSDTIGNKAGKTITLHIIRDGKKKELRVMVGDKDSLSRESLGGRAHLAVLFPCVPCFPWSYAFLPQ